MVTLKRKKILFSGLAILCLAGLSLVYTNLLKSDSSVKRVSIQACVIVFTDTEGLINDSDLVVVASPLDAFEDREPVLSNYSSGDLMSFHTNTKIKISKVLKNNTDLDLKESSIMTIVEPIAVSTNALGEKEILAIEDYKEMEANKEYLMFIQGTLPGIYGLNNLNNGKFELTSSIDAAKSSQEETDPVHVQLKHDLFSKYGLIASQTD
ncbi:hypothetical protein [Gorillibacterium timonense]|uniref:hypothetical protein n=1 Tax=Gorillibacterium timonense TaxID=1689269 RepID=UPI00071D4BE6|nr:hypothetical protein [Gorillibacterium timonense]